MSQDSVQHLAAILKSAADQTPRKTALWFKRDAEWRSLDWSQVWKRTLSAAALFREAGICEGDRVAIWSENRPEWLVSDMAALALGAVTVPIYVTLAAAEIEHILKDSGTKALVVSRSDLFSKIEASLDRLPDLGSVIFIDDASPHATKAFGRRHFSLNSTDRVIAKEFSEEIHARVSGDARQDLATIIYTSGTTGAMKGVMLTHGNFLANIAAVNTAIRLEPSDRHLSFLPLSHVFERLSGYYLVLDRRAEIVYAESIEAMPQNMLEMRPTVLMAVPRFYEKIHAKITAATSQLEGAKKKLFDWALAQGRAVSDCQTTGQTPRFGLKLRIAVANTLVLGKIRARLGGRIRFCVSGGAPLSESVARFFHSVGVLIIEGYGLTETSPVIACNRLDAFRFGTVGKPLEGVPVQIAEDGEILTKSDSVMRGYFGQEEATRAAMKEGWFRTGDLGKIDADGFLKITGRKKDILVTSGGKKISTALVESQFEQTSCIQRCVLFGDGRNFLTALIVPKFDRLKEIAAERGLPSGTPAQMAAAGWVRSEIQRCVDETHRHLAPFEQIKYFHVLDTDFSVDAGELTPTLKARRPAIFAKYGALLEPFYARG